MSIIRIIKKFKTILSAHQKVRIVELVILMVIGGLLEMCSVSLILPFMDMVTNPEASMDKWYVVLLNKLFHFQDSRDLLFFMAIVLALVYIVKSIYLLFEIYIQNRFILSNRVALQQQLLRKFIHRPYEFFLRVNSGEALRIIQTDAVATFVLLSALLNFFTELIISAGLIITIFVITPVITTCIAIVLLLLMLFVNRILKPKMRRYGIVDQESTTGTNKWLLQSIQGIKELKVMQKEEFFQENYNYYSNKGAVAAQNAQILGVAPRFLIEASSMSTLFFLIAASIRSGSSMSEIIPVLSAVAMAAIRLLPSVNRISGTLTTIAYSEPKLDKMIENLRVLDENGYIPTAENGTVKAGANKERLSFQQDIKLERITFRYPESEENVLEDASLTIKKGESVGVIGSSGAGKSTAIDILTGILLPQSGRVLVDNVDIRTDMPAWLDMIGYIPQSIFMLDASIKSNVAFGEKQDEIDEDRLREALKEASLYDFINTLPEGVNTEIGERGVRLSGGQRQRIGIARALYKNPAVLVFDEATSSLDNETEAAIMESIHKLKRKKTMIIIAHRLSTIQDCDHIFRVVNKTIQGEK